MSREALEEILDPDHKGGVFRTQLPNTPAQVLGHTLVIQERHASIAASLRELLLAAHMGSRGRLRAWT